MKRQEVWVFGAGGHAKVVIDCAKSAGAQLLGLFDDDPALAGLDIGGLRVLGGRAEVARLLPGHPDAGFVIAIGRNDLRAQIAATLSGAAAPALVHARATVENSVTLGLGTVVFAGAVINADARIGEHVIVNTCSCIDHDCVVGDFVHVAPGARICGGVEVGAGSLVGAGCVIVPGIKVGAGCVLGAGAVVLDDIPAGTRVAGNPARPL